MADKVCLPTASDIESQIPSERVLTSNSVARVCAHIIMFLLALMLIMVTTITIAAAMVWVDMTYGNSSESFDTLFEKSVGRALGAQTCIMICCMLIYLAYSWRLMLDLHRPSTHAPLRARRCRRTGNRELYLFLWYVCMPVPLPFACVTRANK